MHIKGSLWSEDIKKSLELHILKLDQNYIYFKEIWICNLMNVQLNKTTSILDLWSQSKLLIYIK